MCSDPQEIDGVSFACRSCDACIAVRRAEWVARGVMESTQHKYALAVALTYSDETQFTRDGAAMFRYADVRLFLANLREGLRSIDDTARVRFLAAGEQGDRNARVHWHMILYSNIDMVQVGEKKRMWNRQRVVCDNRKKLMTTPYTEVRVNWSMWPHGYVTFQDADEGAIKYALSYALKDQYTGEKSKHSARFDKSENFATGMFRMSKRPPVGAAYIWSRFEKWYQAGIVPPNLNFKIPGLTGFYHPSGSNRKMILEALYALSKRILWASGGYADAWPSLVGSIPDHLTTNRELLLNGAQADPEGPQWGAAEPDNEYSLERALDLEQRELARRQRIEDVKRRCGRALPCQGCIERLSPKTRESLGLWYFSKPLGDGSFNEWAWLGPDGKPAYPQDAGRLNPYCRAVGSEGTREAFPDSDPIGRYINSQRQTGIR